MEVSTATAAPATTAAPSAPSTGTTSAAPSAPSAPTSAGATLQSVSTGEWYGSFKNDEIKNYVAQKGFKTTEDLATSFYNLEKLKGVPEDRLLKLPEKLEGDDAKNVFQRLGMPKEQKGYEIPRDEKSDPKFLDWAESTFFKNNVTKNQAQGILKEYNDWAMAQVKEQNDLRVSAIATDEQTLKKEWGQHYDTNLNLAKQGAKILGLDGKTLDLIEAIQGRANLFKTLQKIGVGVGESAFVTGEGSQTPTTLTPEQAANEIKQLMQDKKFAKKVARGDQESLNRWNELNRLAAPGEKQIG